MMGVFLDVMHLKKEQQEVRRRCRAAGGRAVQMLRLWLMLKVCILLLS
jgi:hypothetical protein